jgi:hypothetical protein
MQIERSVLVSGAIAGFDRAPPSEVRFEFSCVHVRNRQGMQIHINLRMARN